MPPAAASFVSGRATPLDLDIFSRRITGILDRADADLREHDAGRQGGEFLARMAETVGASARELRLAQEQLRRQSQDLAGALAALEQERRRYRDLFMGAPIGYLVTNRGGKIADINAAAAELLAVESAVALGIPLDVFVAPNDRARFARLLDRTTTEANATAADVLTMRTLQRERTHRVRVRATRKLDDDGAPTGHRFILADAEVERLALQAERLSAEARKKDEFLAMLAHELRNPLAPIRTVVELWRDDDGAFMSAERERIEIVDRQVDHLSHLVDDLLDVSRVSQGKIRLRRTPLDLRQVVEQAHLAVSMAASKHRLTVSMPREPIYVEGDRTRLRQIVVNLLDNALKYTPQGGSIEVELVLQGGEAVLVVQDDGVGLDGDMLDTVFDLFTQGAQTLARSQGGLGVGLTLVRRLAELHGGTVNACSDGAGSGSKFVVRMPRIDAPAADSSATESQVRRLWRRRVLVVDDNVDAADMLGLLLEKDGQRAALAYDGAGAQLQFERFAPEVVLLDLGLPDIDGLELGRRFRERDPHVVLIAVTGYGDEGMVSRSRAAGFHHHVLKPLHLATLRDLLSRSPAAP